MKIYGDVISPFVRATLVTVHELGLTGRVEHVKVNVNPVETNPRLAALNAIGKIPVLETDHRHAVYDSRVIIEYLAHVAGDAALLPDDGVKRFRVLTLQALAQGMAEAAVTLRYETAMRPETARWPEYVQRLERRINAALDDLEANWQPVLATVNAGSICAAVALSYLDFRFAHFGWRTGRPSLAEFHRIFSARDSMARTAIS